MVEITVKTLDGQDRQFDVPGDMTVKQFKEHIAPTVGITVERQRVIFHGRVLQDEKKLSDFDLNGKAVHLVEKPLNRTSELSQNTVLPQQPFRRREVAQQQVMIGSVAIPIADLNAAELVQSIRRVLDRLGEVGRGASINVNQTRDGNSLDVVLSLRGVPPAEVESPAQARLQHVRHIIHHINHSLYHMENDEPHATERSAASDQFVGGDRIDAASPIIPDGCDSSTHNAPQNADVRQKSAASTTEQNSADSASSAAEDLRGVEASPAVGTNQRPSGDRVRNAMVSDLANVFEEVLRLEERLRPHMQRYLTLLREESDFTQNNDAGRRCSRFFNGMQIIMHNISHVYHVLSDLNIHFCEPPPRVLDPRMSQTESNITVHQAEAQITMSFRRANGLNVNEDTATTGNNASVPPTTANTVSTAGATATAANFVPFNVNSTNIDQSGVFNQQSNAGQTATFSHSGFGPVNFNPNAFGALNFNLTGNDPSQNRVTVQMHPDGIGQTTSFSIPIQQLGPQFQQPINTGANANLFSIPNISGANASVFSTPNISGSQHVQQQQPPQNEQQQAQNQPPMNFFQQLMQGVANAGVLLGLAPTMAGARQPNQQAAAATTNQQQQTGFQQQQAVRITRPFMQTGQPRVGIQFGGRLGGPIQPGQQNMAGILRGFQPGLGFPAAGQQVRFQQQQHQHQQNIRPGVPRHQRAGASTVIVNASNSDPIFIGPRPPVDLPLFTVDPYLPCPSRHFDLRNRSPINRRRDVNDTVSTTVPPASQQTNASNDDRPLADIAEFETTIEQILRSVLEGMNDQPINNPSSLGTYNFVPVGSSGGHGDGFEAFVIPMGGSNSTSQRIHPHVTTTFGPAMPSSMNASSSFSTTDEMSPQNRMDTSVDSDNEMTMMVTRLFQTLSQNPSQPMSEFMRSLGRDFEEPGISVFSNIINVLTQVISLGDLLSLFSRMSLTPLDRARTPLRRYFIENVLNGNDRPSEDDLQQAVSRVAADDTEHFETLMANAPTRSNVDLVKSMLNVYKARLLDLIKLCFGFTENENFGDMFYDIVWNCLQQLVSLGVHYHANGAAGFEDLAVNYVASSMSDLSSDVQDVMSASGRDHIHNMIANHVLQESDVEQYVVRKAPESAVQESSSVEIQNSGPSEVQNGKENMKRSAADESSNDHDNSCDNNSRNVEVNSSANDDDWKRHLPADWVKIIEEDVERQRSQPIQKPFSDAYLNGMPMKRRKVVCESKPNMTADSEALFRQTLRSSVNDVSATPITGALTEDVVNSAAVPAALLDTFEENLNDKIRRRLQHDPDFDEKRFPNVKHLFDS